jgi:hypothetical protein
VEWVLTEACLSGLGSFLQFHAGVIGLRDQAWLLAGPPESGKTSLVLGLFAAGAIVLTDEVALLAPRTRCVVPFPRDLIVRRGTLRRFGGALPTAEPSWKGFADQRYLCPADLNPVALTPLPVTHLVFPRLTSGRSSTRRHLGQAEAARRLLDQALNLDRWGARGVEAVATLVERAPAVEVTFADSRAAARSLLASRIA